MSITSPRASPTLSLRSMASLSTLAPPPLPKSANWWEYSNPMESSGPSTKGVEDDRFRRLIDVGSSLLSELDLEEVLKSVVEAARELTGARSAALGVLAPERRDLDRFINVGIDEETQRDIGNLPRGRGVLGELIREPAPLRLGDVNTHPHASGFPPGHPPMHSFLGVPITVRGETYGNLYMTEKRGAKEFDDSDEEAALTLASWAGSRRRAG